MRTLKWEYSQISTGRTPAGSREHVPSQPFVTPGSFPFLSLSSPSQPRGPSLEILLLLVPPSNQSFSRRLSTSCGREVTTSCGREVTLLIPSTCSTLRCRLGRRTDSLRSFFLLHSSDTRFSHGARWTATTSFDLHAHPVSHLTVWLFFPNCGNGEWGRLSDSLESAVPARSYPPTIYSAGR